MVGVAAVGLVGALAVRGVQSQEKGNRIDAFLKVLKLDNSTIQIQVAAIGTIAAVFLISRTLLTMYFARKTLFFLGRESAEVSTRLSRFALLNRGSQIRFSDPQEILFALTSGVEVVIVRIIGAWTQFLVDMSLLVLLFITLFVVSPSLSVETLIFFGLLGFLLGKLLHSKAENAGKTNTKLHVESTSQILSSIRAHREIQVWSRQDYVSRSIGEFRMQLADSTAEVAFMPVMSKSIVEVAMVISIFALSATQFLLSDAPHAVATLGIFVAAGMRIGPAVLRLQQGVLQIKSAAGQAAPTFELASKLGNLEEMDILEVELGIEHYGFKSDIEMKNLSYTYPDGSTEAVCEINLELESGSILAVVGPSGAGKSTLIDLMLGLLTPTQGTVLIAGKPTETILQKWPGAISYVPQEAHLLNDTIENNILFAIEDKQKFRANIDSVLRDAQLYDWVNSLPLGLKTIVGENGIKLSGGQAQRLSIARALITKPKLLILDEATSSLDAITEDGVAEALKKLSGQTTLVIIAHRLSSVRAADKVAYIENGKLICIGSFDTVRSEVPDFEKQASLMGL